MALEATSQRSMRRTSQRILNLTTPYPPQRIRQRSHRSTSRCLSLAQDKEPSRPPEKEIRPSPRPPAIRATLRSTRKDTGTTAGSSSRSIRLTPRPWLLNSSLITASTSPRSSAPTTNLRQPGPTQVTVNITRACNSTMRAIYSNSNKSSRSTSSRSPSIQINTARMQPTRSPH